jgi:spore coat polysaccharide biosynthesis protein SpsF (cytidylyltransferase family)
MSTAIFVTARLGSSRLPRKHLLPAGERVMVEVLIDRIRYAFDKRLRLVIATSDEQENREFERFAPKGVTVFYGPINNIPLRHLEAARALDVACIVSVDGDDVLCSPTAMAAIRDALESGSRYATTVGLPLGMNSFGYRTDFLEESLRGWADKILETGWGRVFEKTAPRSIDMRLRRDAPDTLRFTLDYPEDLAFFQAVTEKLGSRLLSARDEEIVDCVLEHQLFKLTDPVAERYWKDFAAVRAREVVADKEVR